MVCNIDSEEFKREMVEDDSEVVEEIVCKATEVPDGKKKMVEVRGRKILIINDGGTFHAVNGLCPHFNFPLENGVYSNGKLRCPIHGACFHVESGDIEDYPAFDSIHPFQVLIVGEDLTIKTTANRLHSDRRTRKVWIKETSKDKPIVVVGGGLSGQSVVENLRLAGSKSLILMEPEPPYDRILVSKFFAPDILPIRNDEWYKENKIDVKCNSKVVSFDSSSRTVTIDDNSTVEYSKLILATGGKVRRLNGKGNDLKGVHTLRNVTDMKCVLNEVEGKEVVCIGASFIGMETASGLKDKALKVCSTGQAVPAFGEDIGKAFRKKWESNGIHFHTNAIVDHIEGDKEGQVKEVILRSGERIPATLVIVGIGVEPDTEWLGDLNVKLDERGFIIVNEEYETNVEDVFAIGDVVSVPLPFWDIESLNIQHFQTAQKHGQLAAYSIMGKPQPGKVIPFFWTYGMGSGARMAGCTQDYDDTYVSGDLNSFDFVKGDRLVAVANAGSRPSVIQFLSLCDQGVMITKEEVLKSTYDDFSHLLTK